jgi:hypothetical protein
VDPAVVHAPGARRHYAGHSDDYAVPSASACLLCHGGDDREAGTAPIGLKVRNLNKTHDYDGQVINQLAYLQSRGMLDLPAGKTPDMLERMVKFNVPGSGGQTPDSLEDKHQRVRAFLEVNCMHCHNPAGAAQNSGLSLDGFTEPMNFDHGICKPPIAAGKGADSGNFDLQPGDHGVSILFNRMASTTPGIKMPPLARSVPDAEAVNLVGEWIDTVLSQPSFVNPDDDTCSGGGILKGGYLPIPLMTPVPPTAAQKSPWG